MTGIAEAKAIARRQARRARKAFKETPQHADFSGQVCKHLITYLSQRPGAKVASYLAIGSELSLSGLHKELFANVLCLPAINNESRILSFLEFDPLKPLVPGSKNTRQPSNTSDITPDIVLVPLLAYDNAGNRLGQGGGYYDATLSALKYANPKTLAIGAAFSSQKMGAIPYEAHDAALDAIATEQGIAYV